MADPLSQAFLAHLRVVRNRSRHTLRCYRYTLAAFMAFTASRAEGPWALVATTPADILAWLEAQVDQTEASTRATRLACLKSCFAFAVRFGWRADDPTALIDAPKVPKRAPDVLPQAVVARFLDAPWGAPWPGWRDRALCEVLYGAGLRVSEGIGLTVADLDLAQRRALVFGKGAKERIVPLTTRAHQALLPYLALRAARAPAGAGPLWVSVRGGPLAAQGARLMIERRAKRLGLPHIWPHRLRAACATHLFEGGADGRDVQTLLGHASFDTTQRYLAPLTTARLQAVVDRAHPRAG